MNKIYGTVLLLTLAMAGSWAWADEEKRNNPGAPERLDLPGETFQIDGHNAFVLLPAEEHRSEPQPWIMYGPTLPRVPDLHERWMHEQFLESGVAVAGIDAGEAYGSPRGSKLMTALYDELTGKRHFSKKPCLLGRSRGGLWTSAWAIANPDKTAGLAGIYPAYDLRTYPGLARACGAYDLTESQLTADLATHNPIARIGILAKARIPVCIIHGDEDDVVPLKENSLALVDAYKAAGVGTLANLIVAKGQGHNYWEGFFRSLEVVEFAIKQAKAGASANDTAKNIETPAANIDRE